MIELEWGYKIVVMGLLAWMGKTIWYDQKKAVEGKQDTEKCKDLRTNCRELISNKLENLSNKVEDLKKGQEKLIDRIINGK